MCNSKQIQILQITEFSDSVCGRYGSEKGQLQEIIQAPDVVYSKHYIQWITLKPDHFKRTDYLL